MPLSKTGAKLLFDLISQRNERGSTLITSNLPFDEWTKIFGSERLTGALLDRLTHHVNILEMNGERYRHDMPLLRASLTFERISFGVIIHFNAAVELDFFDGIWQLISALVGAAIFLKRIQ